MRDRVIPPDGAITVPGTEVVLDILDQLGDFKGKIRPKAEKYIDAELLNRARKRMQWEEDMKREVAAEIVDSLKEAGIDFVATLTEANLHDLVMALGEDTDIHHVPVTREEEGIGICAGAYLGGKNPAMVMMNAGFLLSANALATVCIHPGIPVLMLIGHSGGVGEENAGHATVGSLTEPVLQAMHIVYEKVGRFDDIRPTIRDSQILARSSRRPTAIVLNKQALR